MLVLERINVDEKEPQRTSHMPFNENVDVSSVLVSSVQNCKGYQQYLD